MSPTLANAARSVSKNFESLGVRLHPQSRVGQVVDLLKDGGVIEPGDERFRTALEGFRDISILYFVIGRLLATIDPAVLRQKLRRIIKDHVHPQDDLTKSPGRDVQTELYVAAVASKAGLSPRFEEPDVLCDLAGEPLGVAVKRVKNEKRFEEHFRGSVSQIAKAGVRGVVTMDMSLAFNRINQPIDTAAKVEQMQLAHWKARTLFVNHYYGQMKGWINAGEVRGLIIIETSRGTTPALGGTSRCFITMCPSTSTTNGDAENSRSSDRPSC
jgi:hypothetical protein